MDDVPLNGAAIFRIRRPVKERGIARIVGKAAFAATLAAPQVTRADAFYCWYLRPEPARIAYVSGIHQHSSESLEMFKRRFAGHVMTTIGQNIKPESVSCVYDDSGAAARQAYSLLEQQLAREGYPNVRYTNY